jgi:type VI secretion system secreted protein Hcp
MRASILAIGFAALGFLGFGAGSASAAVGYFLKIDGVDGEAPPGPHKDWIEILSFQTGIARPPGQGSPTSTGMLITKQLDKATPKLMLACADGSRLDRAKVELVRQGTNQPMQFFKIELKNVYVTSYSATGDAADPSGNETALLTAEEFAMTYVQFDADDQAVDDLTVYWDFLRNEGGIVPIFKLVVVQEGDDLVLTWPARADRTYHVRGSASVDGTYAIDQTVTAAETGPLNTTVPITSPHRFFLIEEVP